MGIYGLQNYLENHCTGGIESVKVSEIAEKYRSEMKKDPVMLVDISNSVILSQNWQPVGPKKYKQNLELFINKCSDIGVKLRFIGEGMKPPSKYSEWRRKQEEHLRRSNHKNFDRGVLLSACTCIIQSSDKCEYMRSRYKADDDIKHYAQTEGCFAILSNDSDFVIMNGTHYVLSPKFVDENFMPTKHYNRNNFAKALNLDVAQLPVFGAVFQSILGCSYIEMQRASKKGKIDLKQKFQQIANEIRNVPVKDLNLKEDERRVFEKILDFYTFKMVETPTEDENGNELNGNDNWNDILRSANKRHVTGVADKRILEVLENRVNFMPDLLIQENRIKKPVHWLLSLRKKIYGILFSEYPQEVSIREYTFKSEVAEDLISFDPFNHSSGLLKLWSEDRSDEMMNTRREIFCRVLNESLTPKMLQDLDLPEELLFLVLALFYLTTRPGSEVSETDTKIFLLQAILVNKLNANEIEKYSTYFDNTDSLALCEWFLMTFQHIEFLNSVCGEPYCRFKTNIVNSFDRGLYNYFYRKNKIGLLQIEISTSPELKDLSDKLEKLCNAVNGKVGSK